MFVIGVTPAGAQFLERAALEGKRAAQVGGHLLEADRHALVTSVFFALAFFLAMVMSCPGPAGNTVGRVVKPERNTERGIVAEPRQAGTGRLRFRRAVRQGAALQGCLAQFGGFLGVIRLVFRRLGQQLGAQGRGDGVAAHVQVIGFAP